MNIRIFYVLVIAMTMIILSETGSAQIQIQVGGHGSNRSVGHSSSRSVSHYPRRQSSAIGHGNQTAGRNYNHYQQDRYRNLDHAVKDVLTRGTTNPYSSRQHNYTDRTRDNYHYRADRYRNYDQYSSGGNRGAYHYQPRSYGIGH